MSALDVCVGSCPGHSMAVRGVETAITRRQGNRIFFRVPMPKKLVVRTTGELSVRCYVLEPDDAYSEVVWGPFYVKGHFRVTDSEEDPKKAIALWRLHVHLSNHNL